MTTSTKILVISSPLNVKVTCAAAIITILVTNTYQVGTEVLWIEEIPHQSSEDLTRTPSSLPQCHVLCQESSRYPPHTLGFLGRVRAMKKEGNW